eukprot:m.394328 g.394328  ORF g.394328 m.394328 type:complete len:51 (-) comp20096_c7_seq14:861-1013(-)
MNRFHCEFAGCDKSFTEQLVVLMSLPRTRGLTRRLLRFQPFVLGVPLFGG